MHYPDSDLLTPTSASRVALSGLPGTSLPEPSGGGLSAAPAAPGAPGAPGAPASPEASDAASGGYAGLAVAVLLLLGAIGLLLGLFRRGNDGSGRRGRAYRSGQESDSLLPPSTQGLFPPTHHERLHDEKYLQRILEAEREKRSQEAAGERQGASERQAEAEDGPRPGSPPAG